MRALRINIILPFISTRPGGGSKIMYEYANRLAARGHEVRVIHSIERPFRKIKSPVWWKQFVYRVRGLSSPPWFQLDANIRSQVVPRITDQFIPDADISFSTWWEMAHMVSKLSPGKGKAFNLIQDFEVWAGYEEEVYKSYSLPIYHLVIAKYLQKILHEKTGSTPPLLPNAIDQQNFFVRTPIAARIPQSVVMMYSEEPRKATQDGLAALKQLKNLFPSMTAELFGVYEKPRISPWMDYHSKPVNLAEVMNRNAIFLTPSISEGWALPPAEAMSCGCALVCSDIGGHADYAIDEKTALVFETNNVQEIVDSISRLFEDEPLRIKIATQGNKLITENYNWEHSVSLLEKYFYEALER